MPSVAVSSSQVAQADLPTLPTHEAPRPGTAPADDQRIVTSEAPAPPTVLAAATDPVSDVRAASTEQTPAPTPAPTSQAVPVEGAENQPAPPATTPSSGSEPGGGAKPTSPATAQAPHRAAAELNPTGADLKAEPAMEPAAPRRDYGWLVSSLRQRIMDLKRYPVGARANRMQGRVVVRAVISDAGHLLDATIAQTSGFDLLDQDALELVRKSCPLTLRESIPQPQVVLKVPVSYSLTY